MRVGILFGEGKNESRDDKHAVENDHSVHFPLEKAHLSSRRVVGHRAEVDEEL